MANGRDIELDQGLLRRSTRTLTAVTGVPSATGDLIRVGERVWNLERRHNLHEAFTKAGAILGRLEPHD